MKKENEDLMWTIGIIGSGVVPGLFIPLLGMAAFAKWRTKPTVKAFKITGEGIAATGKGIIATTRGTKNMLTPKPKEISPPPPPTRQELVAKETKLFNEECEILRSLSQDFKVEGDIEDEIELRRQKYLNRIARIMQ